MIAVCPRALSERAIAMSVDAVDAAKSRFERGEISEDEHDIEVATALASVGLHSVELQAAMQTEGA